MTLKTHLSFFISAALILPSAFGVLCAAYPAKPTAPALPFISVPVNLDTPGYLTAVIEDESGLRVCNLVGEYKSPAGKMTFNWDFYDVGIQPGTYKVRGLVHDGIVMKYEQSVYSPGTPPWKTADMSGTWMGDHANPFDVLFIDKGPNGQPTLILATGSAEAGHALSFCDLTGKKYKGVNSDNFNGADSMKNDRKPGADQNKLYFINGNGLCTLGENDRHVVLMKPTRKKPLPVLGDYAHGDLAVYGGLAVLSESDNRANIDTTTGNLLVVDLATKTELFDLVTGVSRGVAFGTDGKLFALIDGNLVRYQWDAAKKTLVEEAKVITGLISLQRVFIDSAGQFYISVFGDAHQIQVFDKAGKKLHPRPGPSKRRSTADRSTAAAALSTRPTRPSSTTRISPTMRTGRRCPRGKRAGVHALRCCLQRPQKRLAAHGGAHRRPPLPLQSRLPRQYALLQRHLALGRGRGRHRRAGRHHRQLPRHVQR